MRDARTDREKEERSEERWEGGREGRREKGREGYQNVLPEIFLRLTILRTLSIEIFYLLGSKDYVICFFVTLAPIHENNLTANFVKIHFFFFFARIRAIPKKNAKNTIIEKVPFPFFSFFSDARA